MYVPVKVATFVIAVVCLSQALPSPSSTPDSVSSSSTSTRGSSSTTTTTTDSSENDSSEDVTTENFNDTIPQDLYVIKSVVYEIGILTDAGNDTDLNETHQQVSLSIYDPKFNGTLIDLSKIPAPIQTNVSGVEVTGLLPGGLGPLLSPNNSKAPVPILPEKEVKVTQNISTANPKEGSRILSNLPRLLGLGETKINSEESTKTP